MTGIIMKGIGGFYYVRDDAGNITECKAKGRFRKEGLTPTVGDRVVVLEHEEGFAAIDTILPRKNLLIRPVVANIDMLLIVIAASKPEPDMLLVDKLIIQAKLSKTEPVIIINKCDEQEPAVYEKMKKDYGSFAVFPVSAKTGFGMEALRAKLGTGISCFAGQSAVGKSSLMKALIPYANFEIGGLSRKTDRGKHTTRHAELIPFENGALLDTPGFSLYEMDELEQYVLDSCYPEFGSEPEKCRFSSCMHIAEPDCAVKELLRNGGLSKTRYERYCIIAKENEQRRKHRYD